MAKFVKLRGYFSRGRVLTLALAGGGTAVFWGLALPLPFLFGPMCACLAAAFLRLPIEGLGQVSVAGRTILGVAVGASLSPAVLSDLPTIALSVALIPLLIVVVAALGVPFFRYLWKLDTPTAYYAAMPGGLQDMTLLGQEAGGDPRALSLIHATRVLLIVTLSPLILTYGYGASLENPIGAPAQDLPLREIGLMIFAAVFGWLGGLRIGLFGAAILGPLIIAAVLSLSGLLHTRPPREAILLAQFVIGCGIGVHFIGITLQECRKIVLAGGTYMLALAVVAAVFTYFVTALHLGSAVEAFLAFAPGGQAEMTVLAIVAGADLGYVITHHLVRIVCVILGAPIVARIILHRAQANESKPQD